MNIVSYLITIANLQHLSRIGTPLKDTTIHLGSLFELTMDLASLPDFPLEGYRKNGLQKHDNNAVYISQNLRDFIFEGYGSPDDEGVIVKLQYGGEGDIIDISAKYNTLAYLIQEEDSNGLHQEEINKYLKDLGTKLLRENHSKKTFLDKLIP